MNQYMKKCLFVARYQKLLKSYETTTRTSIRLLAAGFEATVTKKLIAGKRPNFLAVHDHGPLPDCQWEDRGIECPTADQPWIQLAPEEWSKQA